jgi:NAD(P)-dependent dehydrogenase (short-subunit alcohol dehydrogenase family)
MPRYEDLKGKTALVTGGANGIGAATVAALHAQGAEVFFCDKDSAAGQRRAAELPGTKFTHVDLTSEKQIARWIKSVAGAQRSIDILANNAAWDPRIPFEKITTQAWDDLFAVNIRAYFLCARECAQAMGSGGSIVNLASITFHAGPSEMSAYVATKGAVIGFTRALARELGPRGIRVNTLSPGWVMTDRQLRDYVDARTKKLIKESQCIPELLEPRELAEVILFLASDASRAITGQEILADRGWHYS